jgi:prevent-host-death family protein
MKTIAAGKFKDRCLRTLDEVAATKTSIAITKRGRPMAKLVPIVKASRSRSLPAAC